MTLIEQKTARFGDIPIDVQIELDRRFLTLREVVSFKEGSIVPLRKSAGEALDIYVGGILLGCGEVIVTNENFGVRITSSAADGQKPAKAPSIERGKQDRADDQKDQAVASRALARLLDERVCVSVVVGRAWLPLGKILKLSKGSFLELDNSLKRPVEVVVNNRALAFGEAVVIDGCYGVRIQTIADAQDGFSWANLTSALSSNGTGTSDGGK